MYYINVLHWRKTKPFLRNIKQCTTSVSYITTRIIISTSFIMKTSKEILQSSGITTPCINLLLSEPLSILFIFINKNDMNCSFLLISQKLIFGSRNLSVCNYLLNYFSNVSLKNYLISYISNILL
jgi:hypothetical protein